MKLVIIAFAISLLGLFTRNKPLTRDRIIKDTVESYNRRLSTIQYFTALRVLRLLTPMVDFKTTFRMIGQDAVFKKKFSDGRAVYISIGKKWNDIVCIQFEGIQVLKILHSKSLWNLKGFVDACDFA